MDKKAYLTLEYDKIISRLVDYASFSASAELAHRLQPQSDLQDVRDRQSATREARHILSLSLDLPFHNARDIRPQIGVARREGVLEPGDLLEIKNTLIVARSARRVLENLIEETPLLSSLAEHLPVGLGLVDQINKTISERGDILDSASDKLSQIRGELKITYERMMARMQRFLSEPSTARMLQEPIITQRNGRHVLPLRAEYKGRIKAVIHDQSSSGATLFIEPLAVVEWNNRYRELVLAERDEIRRILAELTLRIGEHGDVLKHMVEALAELDLACMCARFAQDIDAVEPLLVPTRETGTIHPGSTIRLFKARHPLLDPKTVVPIDVDLDAETYALVITGPNTGGKTLTLKTVGLLILMAQSGLQIPVQSGSTLSVFEDVYADIGDEQSIEQSLSTFSGHVTNINGILNKSTPKSLVLLDELGAGTDPQEGSALARAVLAHLLERGITCLVATHYPELKAYAHTTAGVLNASVEFDLGTLQPTYHLTIGLPGRSNALAIAERLGLPESIITAARAEIDPTDLRAEDLLDEIHRQRDLARQAREAAEIAQKEAEAIRKELADRLDQIEDERFALLEKARLEAEGQLMIVRDELETLRRQLARAHQPLDVVNEVAEVVETLEEELAEPVVRQTPKKPVRKPKGPLRLGEKVHLRSIAQDGVVTGLTEADIEVQVGMLRIRARRSDIIRKGDPEEDSPEPQKSTTKPGKTILPRTHESPGVEMDMRGQRVDEGLDALQGYLEKAFLAGLPFVRIIHGKGTGRLRESVREALRLSPFVDRYESGGDTEGGAGVTVAFIKQN
ncbi:MAG TPA: endonuclease MutS2 [Brevefilum sp.]|nr:endonuclease MutS2 [Brevefilum sp.]HOR18759.1 endonuclease MutS2 [Brevefilum sp.]HPL68660.1 endonuclease MutS2 [Brevefilum sp.]